MKYANSIIHINLFLYISLVEKTAYKKASSEYIRSSMIDELHSKSCDVHKFKKTQRDEFCVFRMNHNQASLILLDSILTHRCPFAVVGGSLCLV